MTDRGRRKPQPRSRYDDYVEYPAETRRPRHVEHFNEIRGRGLAADYYENHPLAPPKPRQQRREQSSYYDQRPTTGARLSPNPRPGPGSRPTSSSKPNNGSRLNLALDRIDNGDFRGALLAVKPRSKSQVRSHSHSYGETRPQRREYSPDYPTDYANDHRRRARSRPRTRSTSRSRAASRPRSKSRKRSSSQGNGRAGGKGHGNWSEAAGAALVAGAIEAYRLRREPGNWSGPKMARVATAALGAATIDKGIDRDPHTTSKRNIAGATLGGLLVNRLANGSRSRSRDRRG